MEYKGNLYAKIGGKYIKISHTDYIEKLIKLVTLCNNTINGKDESSWGLLDVMDGYYQDGFNKELEEIKQLKEELNL